MATGRQQGFYIESTSVVPLIRISDALAAWAALPDRGLAASLTCLDLIKCGEIADADMHHFAAFRKLKALTLSECGDITSAQPLGRCAALVSLKLPLCAKLRDVSGLASCPLLEDVHLSGCRALVDVSALVDCPRLRVLHLNRCVNVVDAGALRDIASLELLNLRSSGATVIPQRNGLRVELG